MNFLEQLNQCRDKLTQDYNFSLKVLSLWEKNLVQFGDLVNEVVDSNHKNTWIYPSSSELKISFCWYEHELSLFEVQERITLFCSKVQKRLTPKEISAGCGKIVYTRKPDIQSPNDDLVYQIKFPHNFSLEFWCIGSSLCKVKYKKVMKEVDVVESIDCGDGSIML